MKQRKQRINDNFVFSIIFYNYALPTIQVANFDLLLMNPKKICQRERKKPTKFSIIVL